MYMDPHDVPLCSLALLSAIASSIAVAFCVLSDNFDTQWTSLMSPARSVTFTHTSALMI